MDGSNQNCFELFLLRGSVHAPFLVKGLLRTRGQFCWSCNNVFKLEIAEIELMIIEESCACWKHQRMDTSLAKQTTGICSSGREGACMALISSSYMTEHICQVL